MEKFFTKIIGTPVYDDSSMPLTTIKDVLMDPENGKVLAFIVDVGKKSVIVPRDVESWQEAIKIHYSDVIIDGRDVLRVDEALKMNVPVFHNKVFAKNGKYLGTVNDFSINTEFMVLDKLYVSRGFLGLVRFESRIIPFNNILEILPDKIIVKNDVGEVREKEAKVTMEEMPAG